MHCDKNMPVTNKIKQNTNDSDKRVNTLSSEDHANTNDPYKRVNTLSSKATEGIKPAEFHYATENTHLQKNQKTHKYALKAKKKKEKKGRQSETGLWTSSLPFRSERFLRLLLNLVRIRQ